MTAAVYLFHGKRISHFYCIVKGNKSPLSNKQDHFCDLPSKPESLQPLTEIRGSVVTVCDRVAHAEAAIAELVIIEPARCVVTAQVCLHLHYVDRKIRGVP